VPFAVSSALAADTPDPASVTIAGSLQDELGCPGDWKPDCAATSLGFDAEDDVWQGVFDVPAGVWEYKAALNGTWDENYGLDAMRDGANIPLDLAAETPVKFYYSHQTHWVTDDQGEVIAVAPGSFQSELGCAGDWDPGCLRSWLQDPDGDGVFSFRTRALPAGAYEAKVAIDESWAENYGAGGVQNGPNIPFNVPADCTEMLFAFDYATKVLTVEPAPAAEEPFAVNIPGSFQSELGCPGDWQPDCLATELGFDAEDGAWQGSFNVPAGNWEYKGALNQTWDENYGLNATPNGPDIPLSLADPMDVKFYYSHRTHWITDNQGAVIATAPGNFQSELGCAGDWDPSCLQSWLQDPDGDGVFGFSAWLPEGSYEVKVAHDESWDENYGEGGVQNGPNIPFSVPQSCTEVFFSYDLASHVLTVGSGGEAPENHPPVAQCADQSVDADGQSCTAEADVDAGSYDPDGDAITLIQDPPGPYAPGVHSVTLTVEDEYGETDVCSAQVTVVDASAPTVECNAPESVSPRDAPLAVTASGLDACGVAVISVGGLDCYAVNPRGKRIDRNGSCELVADGATLRILHTSGVGTHLAWQVTATDADGNSVTADCDLEVVRAQGRPDK
jgi:hypothetical protein